MARIFDATNGTRPTGWAISRAGATATYHNSSGTISTAAANAERLDYDPTSLSLLGLLVEAAGTKSMLRSAELDNAYWTQLSSGVTVSADSTTAPDGTATAELFTGTSTATGTGHGIEKTFSGNSTTSSTTWEIWAKQGPTTPIKRLWLRDDQNVVGGAVFDISTGTVVSGSLYTGSVATIKAYPNGWYRLRVVGPSTSMAFMGWSCVMMTDTGSGFGDHQFNASGRTVYLWGAGFRQFTGTSYIATSASSVTRNADGYSFTLASGVTQVTFTFDDGSTQVITGLTGGSTYTIPTTLNRFWVTYIDDNSSSGTSYSLAVAKGTLALTGQTILLPLGRKVSVSQGSLALTAKALTLPINRGLSVARGNLTLTNEPVSVNAARNIAVARGNLTLTNEPVAATSSRSLAVAGATLSLTPEAISLAIGRVIAVSVARANLNLTPQTILLPIGRMIAVASTPLTLTGKALTPAAVRRIAVACASLGLTAQDIQAHTARVIAVAKANLGLTANSVTLTTSLGHHQLSILTAALGFSFGEVTLTTTGTVAFNALELIPYIKPYPPFDPRSQLEYSETQLRNIEASIRSLLAAVQQLQSRQ